MKEQLANMTIIELVTTAHSYATSIQQIDTYSAIVTEMASRLEALNLAHIGGMNTLRSAISDREQLAAENAALRSAGEIIRHLNANREEANFCGIDDCHIDDAVDAMITPATDAWQREQWARGVERFSGVAETMLVKFANSNCANIPEAIGWRFAAEHAKRYAQQLRNGEAE